MRMPEAEVDIHVDLVRRLIEDQHPDLSGPLSIVANGWDNVIFRLGDDLTVRLPRRELAVSLIENEQQWLPELAAQLPAPIPVPIRRGEPASDFGWPWTIGPWFAGIPATDLPVADRSMIAEPLAAFFAALHTPAPTAAPRNPVRGFRSPNAPTWLNTTWPVAESPTSIASPRCGTSCCARLPGTADRGGCTATRIRPTSWSATADLPQ